MEKWGNSKEKPSPLTRDEAETILTSLRERLGQAKELEDTGEIDGVNMSMRDFFGEKGSMEELKDEIEEIEDYLGELPE